MTTKDSIKCGVDIMFVYGVFPWLLIGVKDPANLGGTILRQVGCMRSEVYEVSRRHIAFSVDGRAGEVVKFKPFGTKKIMIESQMSEAELFTLLGFDFALICL